LGFHSGVFGSIVGPQISVSTQAFATAAADALVNTDVSDGFTASSPTNDEVSIMMSNVVQSVGSSPFLLALTIQSYHRQASLNWFVSEIDHQCPDP
jgi:hypothetical protein